MRQLKVAVAASGKGNEYSEIHEGNHMRALHEVNSWTLAWGLALLSLGLSQVLPAQAQQNTLDLADLGYEPQHHNLKHHHYKLIDLGTFGGPQSFVNVPNVGIAPVLNNSGTVVGYADTSVPDPHPKICFQDCFVAHAFRSKGTGKSDLGSLRDEVPTSSQPNWISESGLIAGVSENGEIDPLVPGLPEFRAVLWGEHGIVTLGTLEGGYESVANAVNNDGQVVGLSTNTIPDANSMFFGFGFQTRAFSWKDGVMQDLGTLGGTDAQALIVNEGGQVAGESYLNSDPSPACASDGLPLSSGVFLWENGVMTNLGSFGGTCTLLGDLNNRGQIVGFSYLPGDQNDHAFLWENGTMKDLGNTFGGPDSVALAINEAGHAVGWGQAAGNKFVQHASLWKNGVQTDLGPSGTDCAFAVSINSKDQIVGSSYPICDFINPHFSGFIYENGELADLNTLIGPHPKLHISEPETINDRGEIAGIGVTSDGKDHAFLLIPNGECGDDCCDANCEESIAASQSNAAIPVPAESTANWGSSNPEHNRLGRLGRRYSMAGLAMATSSPASVTTQIEPAPTNLTSVGIEAYGRGHLVKLFWTNHSTDADSIHVETCSGSTCTNFYEIAQLAPNAISNFHGFRVYQDLTFRFRVRAHGPRGYSAYSNVSTQILP
jgi:probable HAF family extracellular repeat protein